MDRDGVINNIIVKHGKAYSPRVLEEFIFTPNIISQIKRIKEAGYLVVVVTNQPDIARDKLSVKELERIHKKIESELNVDDIFVCPHDDNDNCTCRKPKPGMIFDAVKKYDIDLSNSYFIGDGWKDMEAAKTAGCEGILINANYNEGISCLTRVKNLSEAIDLIINHEHVM